MNNFIFKKYVQFIERNGYFPMMFNPYNCSEITNVSPTLTTNCGGKGSSATVLITSLGDEEMNKMIDEDDLHFGKGLHFIEYNAYHEGKPAVEAYENNSKNWMLVQLDDGKLDIAKNVWADDKKVDSVWKNQDGKVLDNVINWRPIYPNFEV